MLFGVVIVLAILAVALYLVTKNKPEPAPVPVVPAPVVVPVATVVKSSIGTSVGGRAIEAFTYGTGEKKVTLIGGIHGGYEWNSVLLAYEMMDYFEANLSQIPAGVSVTIIPSLNPDAVFKVTSKEGRFTQADVSTDEALLASARFNANGVDLNRNFDCKWQPKSMWRSQEVSAGTSPMSEPESAALVNYVAGAKPNIVVFYHSQASAVYASLCEREILPATKSAHAAYAAGSGYRAEDSFDNYTITGDAGDWLAKIGVPAISIELTNHSDTEFSKNIAGVKALFGVI